LLTTAYHPQTDGMVEKFNGTLEKMLAINTNAEQNDWDLLIPFKLFAYRASTHSDTGYSPFQLMYGREPNSPMDIALQPSEEVKISSHTQYLKSLPETMKVAKQDALAHSSAEREKREKHYNKKRKPSNFKAGDLVYLNSERVSPGPGLSPKLAPLWKGPFTIKSVDQHNTVTLCSKDNEKFTYKTNVDRIIHCVKHLQIRFGVIKGTAERD